MIVFTRVSLGIIKVYLGFSLTTSAVQVSVETEFGVTCVEPTAFATMDVVADMLTLTEPANSAEAEILVVAAMDTDTSPGVTSPACAETETLEDNDATPENCVPNGAAATVTEDDSDDDASNTPLASVLTDAVDERLASPPTNTCASMSCWKYPSSM